ncbi:MAG: dipeptide epimerase, partial [Calditrichaeota bacterium]
MKITKMEAWVDEMPLKQAYSIAYETIDKSSNVFLRVETNTGLMGYGCAAPDLQVTGETPMSVLHAVDSVISPALANSDPMRSAMLMERLKACLQNQPSALAAVDMALYDLLGKVANLPLWKLLGGFRDRMKTSVTIGILPVEETLHEAASWLAKGFKRLKIKGGAQVET